MSYSFIQRTRGKRGFRTAIRSGFPRPAARWNSRRHSLKVSNRAVLDPFLWFSVYNNFVSYLFGGNALASIPRIPIGEAEYLPSVHVTLSPFGVETYLENYLIINEILYMLTFRLGDQSYYDSWAGLGLQVSNPFARSRFSMDLSLDIWKQPGLELDAGKTITDGVVGAAFSVRTYHELPDANLPIKAILELGYKSAGFLEGYPLAASPILAVGLQL